MSDSVKLVKSIGISIITILIPCIWAGKSWFAQTLVICYRENTSRYISDVKLY